MTILRLFGLAVTACLAGCSTPVPSVKSWGALPTSGSYGFGQDGTPPPPALTALSAELHHKGLTASDSPQYLVQSGYSHPPAKTGALEADQSDPQWRRAPAKSGGTVSRLSLSVTEIATGTEIYHGTAWQRTRGKTQDDAMLMQALLNAPPAPTP